MLFAFWIKRHSTFLQPVIDVVYCMPGLLDRCRMRSTKPGGQGNQVTMDGKRVIATMAVASLPGPNYGMRASQIRWSLLFREWRAVFLVGELALVATLLRSTQISNSVF